MYAAVKRAIDLLGAVVGLAVAALFFIPIAAAIKLDSRGPVIFAQLRVGLNEEVFRIYK